MFVSKDWFDSDLRRDLYHTCLNLFLLQRFGCKRHSDLPFLKKAFAISRQRGRNTRAGLKRNSGYLWLSMTITDCHYQWLCFRTSWHKNQVNDRCFAWIACRSELLVRATVAEEQLKQLQKHLKEWLLWINFLCKSLGTVEHWRKLHSWA